jgi:predicted phage-related endonuclease
MTGDERTAWLRDRQSGLGGTDLASICGVGFQDAAAVYAEKVAAEPVDRPPTVLMRLGLATEAFNAGLYAERYACRLVSPGLVRADPEPWAFATYDRVRVDAADVVGCPVELKYTPFFGDGWGPDGSDEVRDGYTVQATWEALVLRLSGHAVARTDLSVLAGSGEHRVYPVPFDEALGAMLLEIGRDFWARVTARAGVADWRHPLRDEVARRLLATRPGTTVAASPEVEALVAEIEGLTLVKREGEAAGERVKLLKGRVVELLGTAEAAVLPDGRRVKLYPVPAAVIAPAPYERAARVDVRIINSPKGKVRGE